MTIQMLRTWNGYEQFGVYTLSGAEETRLITAGLAQSYVAPSRVPGDGISFADFAAMYAAPADDGATATVVAPVIPGGIPYTKWVRVSGVWRLRGRQELLTDFAPSVGVASTSEQILRSILLPAGILQSLRYIRIYAAFAKTGTTDAASAVRFRLGGSGAVSDQTMIGDTGFAASNRQRSIDTAFAANGESLGFFLTPTGGILGTNSTAAAYPQNFTPVSGTSGALYLSLTVQMAGATDTPAATQIIVEGA